MEIKAALKINFELWTGQDISVTIEPHFLQHNWNQLQTIIEQWI